MALGNDGVILDGTVLYADFDGSTELVNTKKPEFAAAIYKSFLACAARIIRHRGGSITGYDGDRIMAVFIGGAKNITATETGLKINYAVLKIINHAIKDQYPNSRYCSWPARRSGGERPGMGGKGGNYAAKLSARSGPATQITSDVYARLNNN